MKMNSRSQKTTNTQALENTAQRKKSKSTSGFSDNRPEAIRQQKLSETINNHSSKVIQRFTIVDPANYTKAGKDQGNMFPSNQLDKSTTTTQDQQGKSITKKLNWGLRYAQNPSLKVSEKGLLALESTVGQPRAFYGRSDEIESFRKRLINIKSRITLNQVSGSSVTVPKDPEHPGNETNKLVKVVPERSPHIKPQEQLMDHNVCTNVSSKITGGKILSIGNEFEGEKLVGKVMNSLGLNKTINSMDENSTLNDFSDEQEKNNHASIVYNPPNFIKPEVAKYFENSTFSWKHLEPKPIILKALSLDGIPKKLWKQVYELHLGKSEEERPNEFEILDHINAYLLMTETFKYNHQKKKKNLVSKFGINEMVNPEVGESFSTFAQVSPEVVDEHGAYTHEINTSKMDDEEMNALMKEFLKVKKSTGELSKFGSDQYKKAKGLVPFGEHHAAVVAKDGGDSITFENYNRGVESDTLKEEVWDTWFSNMDQLKNEVSQTVQEMFQKIRNERKRQGFPGIKLKYLAILKKKKENLEQFEQGFVQVNDQVRAKLDSNFLTNENDLWHFNMYGPAGKTFVDEKNQVKPQSFHETWSDSIPNAITVRTTALVDDGMLNEIRQKASLAAYQIVKAGNFTDHESAYEEILAVLLKDVNPERKRIDMSDLMNRLDAIELKYPDLSSQEEQEAKMLFSKNTKEILKRGLELRQSSTTELQRSEFNYKMAVRYLATNRELGMKYFNWYKENKQESARLSQKADFFIRFYKGSN